MKGNYVVPVVFVLGVCILAITQDKDGDILGPPDWHHTLAPEGGYEIQPTVEPLTGNLRGNKI